MNCEHFSFRTQTILKYKKSFSSKWIFYCYSLAYFSCTVEYKFTRNSVALKSEMFFQLLDGFSFIALDENENI